MENWIYHHSTGFLNYTSVLSNSAILERWCESDVDSEELERSVRVHTI
jgi:hypothetical protein